MSYVYIMLAATTVIITQQGFIFCVPTYGSDASAGDSSILTSQGESDSAPLCGVIATIACMQARGHADPLYGELDWSRYASHRSGSSLADLRELANDFGVDNCAVFGMVTDDLDRLEFPAVLHVRTAIRERAFDHWIAFLGTSGGKYRVFDLNEGYIEIDHGSLAARWDGRALIIGTKDRAELPLTMMRTGRLAAIFFVAGALFARPYIQAAIPRHKSYWSFLCFGVLSALFGLVVDLSSPSGIIRNYDIVPLVLGRHINDGYCTVDTDAIIRFIDTEDIVLIDARPNVQHAKGTIPGAISLPAISAPSAVDVALRSIGNDRRIIVFCEHSRCKYSHEVADLLIANGFKSVCIYPDGYRGWKRRRTS